MSGNGVRMTITEWFGYRRRRLALADYNRGYDYAAGRLLRGTPPYTVLEYSGYFEEGTPGDFDRGGLAAVFAWEHR